MNGIGKDPAFVLTLALGTFAVGGFLAVSHLGRTSAPQQLSSSFSSRFAPEQAQAAPAVTASHLENFKRGTREIKSRAAAAASSFGFSFGGPAPAARTATASAARNESWRYASSSSRGQYSDDGARDWASAYYKGPKGMNAGGSKSWSASGGGVSKTGASASAAWTASEEGVAPAGEEMPGVDKAAVASYARAQASAAAAGQAASAMYASLPAGGNSSYPSAGAPSRNVYGGGASAGVPAGNTGSVSAMRGGVSAADLGGAGESQRSEAMDLLKFRAPGAGAGGEVASPDVSQAKVVEGGGSSAGGASGGSSSSGSSSGGSAGASSSASAGGSSSAGGPAATAPKKKTEDNPQAPPAPVMFAYAQGNDFFQEIASEKLNGRDERYLRSAPTQQFKSMEGPENDGLESLLKPRTIHPSPAPSGSEKSAPAAAETPDPERLDEVSGARMEAIKLEAHLFLHRLESRYGKTSDIQRVSCNSDRDTCRDHRLRGAYLTMVTASGAKLALGIKRGDRGSHGHRGDGRRGYGRPDAGEREPAKWRLYTIDFVDGEGRRPGETSGDAGGEIE